MRLLAGVGLLFGVLLANIAATQAESGLSFTPAFLRVTLPKGENVQYASVAIRNNTTAAAKLKASVVDVDINSTELTPLSSTNSAAARAITVTNPTITLQPAQSINLMVKVDGTRLASGGQYASILIKEEVLSAGKSVPITQAVSIGVFVIKEEGSVRSLTIQSRLPSGVRFNAPKKLDLQLKANGNLAVIPHAAITVQEGDEVIAKATINDRSESIMPDQNKTFPVNFSYEKSLSPGRHTVLVTYRYEGQPVPEVKEATFWYLPAWYLLLIAAGITTAVLFIRHYLHPIKRSSLELAALGSRKFVKTEKPLPPTVKISPVTVDEIEALSMPLPTSITIAVEEADKPSEVEKPPASNKKVSKKSDSRKTHAGSKKQSKKSEKKIAKKSK